MFSLIVAFALGTGPEFTVVNKVPPAFKVVNKTADPFAVANKRATVTKTVIQTTYRQPSGHTHTPSCGHTSDHLSMGSDHVCRALVIRNGVVQECRAVQFVQDARPRMVTATKTAQVQVPIEETPSATPQFINPPRAVPVARPAIRASGG